MSLSEISANSIHKLQIKLVIGDDIKHQIWEWTEANKKKWKTVLENEQSNKTFKHKSVKFSMLNSAMNIWVENVIAEGVVLTDLLIKEKAKKILLKRLIYKKISYVFLMDG
ncbi:hypothetical protein C1645_814055 [Glomus cerebriforme]|uniref:DDE-1 domain-containing protein n=1 Tax=Glomus cerebriforme TaxID=658196 RepID=A0A397TR13_9GLOM|nr:hypothetical protein C1645_814055 [Glomus cerebriforme]